MASTVIVEAGAADFAALLENAAPDGLCLVPDSALAPPAVLAMLAQLAADIRAQFAPSAWMMVESGEIVGLCSLVSMPAERAVTIGYGVAPSRQGRGCASRAVGDLLAWARGDARVAVLQAETAVDNIASQRVLERNGFVRAGERVDAEDGVLFCWQAATA